MKKIIFITLKIAVAAIALWLLSHSSLLKFELFSHAFEKPLLLISIIAIYLFMVLINVYRWYLLNKAQEITLSFTQTIIPTYVGIAFNNLLPGNMGGDFIRLYYLIKQKEYQKSRIFLSIFMDRFTGLMGIFVIVGWIALTNISLFIHDQTLHVLLLCSIIFGLLGSLFLYFLFFTKKGNLKTILLRYFSRWEHSLRSFIEAWHIYRHAKWVIMQCLILSVIIQLFMVFVIVLISHLIGLPSVPLIDYALASALTQLVNLIPLSPGGLGIGEMAFANILLALNPGMTSPFSTLFLGYRLFGVISYLPAVGLYLTNFNFRDHYGYKKT